MADDTHERDFQGSFFSFELDGVEVAYFTGVSGLSLEYDVINFKQTNGQMKNEIKRPGKPKYSEVVFKRGFTADDKLYKWFDEVLEAKDKPPYKTASIVIHDRTGAEVARFNLDRCWPSKLSVSDLQAGSDEVMVEEVTIQHELFTWVKK